MIQPAIVIVAYNRVYSLKRNLEGLLRAEIPSGTALVISIDRSDSTAVADFARGFSWPHGEKRVVERSEKLGLKKHIILCGNLTNEFGSIILLEDDIYPSPQFYRYAQSALQYYEAEEEIAGVSLYAHQFNESSYMNFAPLMDDSDVYFLRLPSSWGQAWTKRQWNQFSTWFEQQKDRPITRDDNVPNDIAAWPNSSWKKYFVKFMNDQHKFFVFPRQSVTTNFADAGTHQEVEITTLQVPINLAKKRYRYVPLKESNCVYDSYLELLPDKVKKLVPELAAYDFAVDLYGVKPLDQLKSTYLLTAKICSKAVKTYALKVKPHEMNVIQGIEGGELSLALTADCQQKINYPLSYGMSYYFGIPVDVFEHLSLTKGYSGLTRYDQLLVLKTIEYK